MTQVLLLSFRWISFLVSLFISIQFFFPWVAGCHLIIWDVCHKTISRLFFSLLVFQQLHPTLLLKMPFQTLIVIEVGICFSILLFQLSIFYSFVPEALKCCSFQPIISFVKDHVLFVLIHLTGVLCPLLKFFHFIKPCISFQPECCSNLFFLVLFFLTECFQLRSFSLHSFFQFVQPLKARGFTRLSNKQLSYTSSLSLPFSLRCHSRSRDEILL